MPAKLSRRRGLRSAAPKPVYRWFLIGVELLIGANAVYGGIGLMVNGMGMPMEWLDGTPFESWLLPGVFLLLIIAVPMVAAAVAELVRSPWAYLVSLAAGLLQIGWIVGQVAILQRYFFLQPMLLAAGVAISALAWWSHRGQTLLPVTES
jgi:hypothetical protein